MGDVVELVGFMNFDFFQKYSFTSICFSKLWIIQFVHANNNRPVFTRILWIEIKSRFSYAMSGYKWFITMLSTNPKPRYRTKKFLRVFNKNELLKVIILQKNMI